jgi:pantoate--beta-alanine ligase
VQRYGFSGKIQIHNYCHYQIRMILFKKAAAFSSYIQGVHHAQNSTGFVPTMGALHQGHLSLIAAAKEQNPVAIASIFVNPTQFNNKSDFEKYPVTIERDIELLEAAGCNALFLPNVAEIYPDGTVQTRHYQLNFLETVLEGKYRPGHFQGVCNVMHRLLSIIPATHLYMGQKDYQQCMVVKRLLSLINSATVLHTCPTLREADGLAMSSRNMRLNETERHNAVAISKALFSMKEQLNNMPVPTIINQAAQLLLQHHFKIDYIEITDATTLQPVTNHNGQQQLVALIAAFQNDVRLIDNLVLN